MNSPLSPAGVAAGVAVLLMLSACQDRAPAPGPAATAAASAAALAAPAAPRRIGLLGGMQPGDTITVKTCTLVPAAPGGTADLCIIEVKATAPASGDQCELDLDEAVSLPKETVHLRWTVAGNTTHDFQFRANALPAGFGVRLIDNDIYEPTAPAAPASAASSPMRPLWFPVSTGPQAVQMKREARAWPPRISAYDIYLEYKANGAKDWTACKTWDPIIISRD